MTHQQNTPAVVEPRQTTDASAGQAGYDDDRALDVLGYLATLARFLRPTLVVTVLVFALGVGYAVTRPASYSAEVLVRLVPGEVTSEAESVQQAAVLPMVVRNYVQLATSPLVLDPVAQASGQPNLTGSSLANRLTVGYPANSLLLRFTFIGTDPTETAQFANAIADEFVRQVPELGQSSDGKVQLAAEVIYRPAMPLTPLPSTRIQTLLMAVVGAVAIGLLTALMLDLIFARLLPSAFVQGLRGKKKAVGNTEPST